MIEFGLGWDRYHADTMHWCMILFLEIPLVCLYLVPLRALPSTDARDVERVQAEGTQRTWVFAGGWGVCYHIAVCSWSGMRGEVFTLL